MSGPPLGDECAGYRVPPSTCKQQGSTIVTCTAPYRGISAVVFMAYPSLKTLYAAYQAKVASLNSGQFKHNFNDCLTEQFQGEVGWNHQFQHMKTYTVQQMSMGMVAQTQAAGRVFCNLTQGLNIWSGPRTSEISWPGWQARCTRTCGTGGWRSITTSPSAAPMNMNM
jgi:hypothetical protein